MNPLTATITPWHLLIPVKGTTGAKTRLTAPPGVDRCALALAFALDTIEAAARTLARRPGSRLLVVTADDAVSNQLLALPHGSAIELVPDPGSGLNAAVRAGLAHTDSARWRGVLLGDLPALSVTDLDAALAAAERVEAGLVPDAAGTGSTLVTLAPGRGLEPAFGSGSAAKHQRAGHVALSAGVTVRTDVDDEADLRAALALGAGRHTSALLAAHLS